MHDGLICIFFVVVISTVIPSLHSYFFRKHAVNIRPSTYISMVSSSSVKYSLENNLLLLFFYHASLPCLKPLRLLRSGADLSANSSAHAKRKQGFTRSRTKTKHYCTSRPGGIHLLRPQLLKQNCDEICDITNIFEDFLENNL